MAVVTQDKKYASRKLYRQKVAADTVTQLCEDDFPSLASLKR